MSSPYRHINVQRTVDVFLVTLKETRLDDAAIRAMSEEVESMVLREKCRKLVMSLGELTCLYSVLVAKLIKLRRLMSEQHGSLKLCNITRRFAMFSNRVSCRHTRSRQDCDTAVQALAQQR